MNDGFLDNSNGEAPLGIPNIDIPPTFWQFYFSMRGRVSLKQYWLRFVLPCGSLGILVCAIGAYVLYLGWHHRLSDHIVFGVSVSVFIMICTLGAISGMLTIKRINDVNMSLDRELAIKDIIPFGEGYLQLLMLFKPGTVGPNRYGTDPRQWD